MKSQILVALIAMVAQAVKITNINSTDMMAQGMQLDNEADMWKALATADSKDIVDGDLI